MIKSDFLHVDTNSLKLKVDWDGRGHKWCNNFGCRNVKLAVSHKEIKGIS